MFLDSVFNDRLLEGMSAAKETYGEAAEYEAWQGNKPQLSAEVTKIVARFRQPPRFDREATDLITFDVSIEFRRSEGTTIVRTGLPLSPALRGGVRCHLSDKKQFRLFIEGANNTGLAVIMPRVDVKGQFPGAVFMCPRYLALPKGSSRSAPRLVDSEYRLFRTFFAVAGEAQGQALSGVGIGLARASLLTSPNTPRSEEYEDETYAKDPEVSVSYKPYKKENLQDKDESGDIVAGIQAAVELQRPAGFKKLSVLRDVVWVKQVMLESETPLSTLTERGEEVAIGRGACYIVLTERSMEHRYSRDNFELPERLQSSDAFSSEMSESAAGGAADSSAAAFAASPDDGKSLDSVQENP